MRWNLRHRYRTWNSERGETPTAIMIGLAVFAILSLSAGPAILSFTRHASETTNDRRADKALAVLADTTRRESWQNLPVGGPSTQEVELAGYDATVATWVREDPDSDSRKLVTLAVAPHLSDVDCTTASDPDDLPGDCLVRTVTVTATVADVRPPMSPLVTVANQNWTTDAPTTLTSGTNLFDVKVTAPTRVAVVARTSSDVTLRMVSKDIERARVTLLPSSGTGTQWRFGNAVLCPGWSPGQASTAQIVTPASTDLSDLLVLTSPAPATACP